jgi:hypothetical protein
MLTLLVDFGSSGDLADVINRSNSGVDRCRVSDLRGSKVKGSVWKRRTALITLPCDTVMACDYMHAR